MTRKLLNAIKNDEVRTSATDVRDHTLLFNFSRQLLHINNSQRQRTMLVTMSDDKKSAAEPTVIFATSQVVFLVDFKHNVCRILINSRRIFLSSVGFHQAAKV
jgi:hypothetical protein